MTKAYDIVGYSYQADTFCPNCIQDQVRKDILEALHGPVDEDGGEYPWDAEWFLDQIALHVDINRQDETTFDSDHFPKVIFASQVEDTEHCGNPSCEETL